MDARGTNQPEYLAGLFGFSFWRITQNLCGAGRLQVVLAESILPDNNACAHELLFATVVLIFLFSPWTNQLLLGVSGGGSYPSSSRKASLNRGEGKRIEDIVRRYRTQDQALFVRPDIAHANRQTCDLPEMQIGFLPCFLQQKECPSLSNSIARS